MRFMLVTWSGGGNSTPTFGLAQALLQQGHEVIILGSDRVRDRAAAIGAGFRPYLSASEPSIMEGVFEEVIFDWAMFACGAELANDVLIQLDDVPDALIVDIMLPAALAAAEKSGLPTAVLGHLLYQGFREGPSAHQWDPVLPLIDTTRSALGLESLEPDQPFPAELEHRVGLLLACVPESLDLPLSDRPPNLRYVGPIHEPSDEVWELASGPDLPLVLVSLSTTNMHQGPLLGRIFEAVAELNIEVLCTLGRIDLGEIHPPDNVTLKDWVPHEAVLPHVSAVVSHGGLSTILASLAHGVPMVLLPLGRDQPANAERIESLGLGRHLTVDAPPRAISTALLDVLEIPAYRAAAERVSQDIAAYGNGRKAVAELEALVEQDGGT